jgi:hypothetical protein
MRVWRRFSIPSHASTDVFILKKKIMKNENQPHDTKISLSHEFPPGVDAGTEIILQVQVSCTNGCNLVGKKLKIIAEDGQILKEIALSQFAEKVNKTEEVTLQAPNQPGVYTWLIVYPQQEEEGILYHETSERFQFTVKAHRPSIAVWDLPSPVVVQSKFKIKAGVKCSANCKLTNKKVEIYNEKGVMVSAVHLGDTPWEQSKALYWTEAELISPEVEDYFKWTIQFSNQELEIPHEAAITAFGFRTAKKPEHQVRIKVVEKETQAPVKKAYVVIDIYRTYVDEEGLATLKVPKGTYELYVWERGYDTFQRTIEVNSDLSIQAELLTVPPI